MERRAFLALLSSPAVVAFLHACGGDDGAGPGSVKEARSALARLAADPSTATGGARAVNALGADLYERLASGNATNVVFSPTSILLALAMTRAGALGPTADEMDAVLHVAEAGPEPGAIHGALNALTHDLAARSGSFKADNGTFEVELSIANSLWGQDGITWVEAFLDLLATEYGAGMRLVDYRADPEKARAAINRWISDETKRRIPELLGAGTVKPDTRLALVNAIYLKAAWREAFLEKSTESGAFTTAAGTTVQVPIMHSGGELRYAAGDGWQAVEVPYIGDQLAMLLLVPDGGRLANVEAGFTTGLLDDAVTALADRIVNLGLPKFDLETKAELAEVMAALGMPTAFDPDRADFTAMTLQERLYIDLIVHQANITVDEKGTEAAAATAVLMRPGSAPGAPPVELTIDRPFLFALRDVPTGAVLFLGRVTDPS